MSKFSEYFDFIYPSELEIRETAECATPASYLDGFLYMDDGKLGTRLYDKRNDFNFPIVNYPFLRSSNVPSGPTCGVYVSQLIRHARAFSNYQDCVDRTKLLTTRLLMQGYLKPKLVSTLRKFYGKHHDLVHPFEVAVSKHISDLLPQLIKLWLVSVYLTGQYPK